MPCPPESCIACEQGRNCPRRISMQLHRMDPIEMARRHGQEAASEPAADRWEAWCRWVLIAAGLLALAAVLYEARPL